MKFKTYEEYKTKRDELINQATQIVSNSETDDDINRANEIMEQIELIDSENEHLLLNMVNERSYKDNYKPTNIYNKGVNIEGGTIIDSIGNTYTKEGEGMNQSIFLNKSDKLADRVKHSEEDKPLFKEGALGNIIRGIVNGQWNDTALKNTVTTTSAGVLIPSVLSSQIIDLSRDMSLFTQAGVPIVPMETNNLTISRVKTDPVFKFKEEGKEATGNSFELDDVQLKSKTVYGYAYLTLEAINSSANLDTVARTVFAQAMAQAIDKTFLYGQYNGSSYDTFAPDGIINDTNINSLEATAGGGYDDIIKAIGKVRKANGNPTVLGINSNTEELFSLLKTTDGQYLTKPQSVEALNQVVSNQLKHDDSTGDDAIVFDPNALLIGLQNNIQIKIIEDTECLRKGLVGFQIYAMLDCKSVKPKHICKITGIKSSPLI